MSKLITIKDIFPWQGATSNLIWKDVDSFDDLDYERCTQCYGICFYKSKMVIGRRKKGHWGPIGGTIEKGETFEETLRREIVEEANMRILGFLPVGYQEIVQDNGGSIFQLRFVCKVEPIGKFKEDPDGSIDEIKLVDPKDYKKYFDWGKVGDRIIERAVELFNNKIKR